MKSKKGFTLIELMIVVAIIAIIAAIAIPNLLRSRMQANETNAIGALKTYASAQSIYLKSNFSAGSSPHSGNTQEYASTLAQLADKDLIGPAFTAATTVNTGYQGYYFGSATQSSWKYDFNLYSWPCVYDKTGVNSFYIDGVGEVRGKDLGSSGSGTTPTVDTTWWTP